jgi:integrase
MATIKASLSQTRTGVAIKATKTERARVVPLSVLAIDALRRQRVMQAREKLAAGGGYDDLGFVFTGPVGGMVKPMVLTDAFRDLARKAKLPLTSIHALRHTAATWMLAGGVDIRSAAGILGHSTPATTLGVYAHAIASAQSAAVETIDARLKSAREAK